MNNNIPYIRMAMAGDAAKIADLSRTTFHDTFSRYNTRENMEKFMNEQFSRDRLMDECKDPENIFLLACLNDKLVGYVKLRRSDEYSDRPGPDAVEIVRIYAVQELIGQGIGKLLMESAIEFARGRKFIFIWLGVWDENERAIAFYKKWGFETYGSHVFMLGDDPQTDLLFYRKL